MLPKGPFYLGYTRGVAKGKRLASGKLLAWLLQHVWQQDIIG